MDAFIARQPILDRRLVVHAYELLFRSRLNDCCDHPDLDEASSKVITASLLLPGLDALTGGRPAFINVTRELLVRDWVSLLPASSTVVELLETIEPDDEVVKACRHLRSQGYTLALDDFKRGSPWMSRLDLVDIVKVDTVASGPEERAVLARQLRPTGLILLAEKVETPEVHRETRGLGYGLFQGYFFARPTTVPGRDIPVSQLNHLELMREIYKPGLDFAAIEDIVEHEVALSYKLLRYLNAAFFNWRGPVDSIRHALMLLGEREVKRWASVILMASMAREKPDELVTQALLRGRHCELLAPAAGLASRSHDLFLMGAFSLMDAMLDRPLAEILERLPLAQDVEAALLGEPGPLRDLLELVVAYAACDWPVVASRASRLHIGEAAIPAFYFEALRWHNAGFDGSQAALAA